MKHWYPQERWCDHFTMAAAARLLHAKSHLLATDDEIQAHQIAEDEAKRLAFHEGLRKRGIAVPGDAERSSGLR
jgi:hypothetical protein